MRKVQISNQSQSFVTIKLKINFLYIPCNTELNPFAIFSKIATSALLDVSNAYTYCSGYKTNAEFLLQKGLK